MRKYQKFVPDERIRIVFKGLSKKTTVSRLCIEEGVSTSQFYNWKNLILEVVKNNIPKKTKILIEEKSLIEKQKKIISTLEEKNRLLKNYIRNSGLEKRYFRYSFLQKKKIIEVVEKSNLSLNDTLKCLYVYRSNFYKWKKEMELNPDGKHLFEKVKRKFQLPIYRDAVFSILHSPPRAHGFNRTTWRMHDLQKTMHERGLGIGKHYISRIIKNEGYRFLKARKVLTSTDPEYKEKLKRITEVLLNLKHDEKFFSIDEYGPFAVKIQGGRSLTPPGQYYTYPQFQKSKGCLILTGALELSTNQFTHFYSLKKNTEEMIKLLEILVAKYKSQKCIYLSWDAASWHASKELYKKVEGLNKSKNSPTVKLIPLPACAQFLNVIESVFSGMAKAVIHNSNYSSKEECMSAIDRHFRERNEFYLKNPKRAGKKLWGKELVVPVFNESNNCKDPKYQHDYK